MGQVKEGGKEEGRKQHRAAWQRGPVGGCYRMRTQVPILTPHLIRPWTAPCLGISPIEIGVLLYLFI